MGRCAIRLAGLGVPALLAGCVVVDGDSTCGRDLSDLVMFATAIDNGSTMRAEVELQESSVLAESLALCKKDELRILDSDPEEVVHGERLVYSVTTEIENAPRDIAVSYEHAGDRIEFRLELPPPFLVTAPTADADIPRSKDFTLAWEPANPGGSMRIGILEEIGYGICLSTEVEMQTYKQPDGIEVDDSGSWLVTAKAIDGAMRDRCKASYWFTRSAEAAYPAELHPGGTLTAETTRTVAFRSVP